MGAWFLFELALDCEKLIFLDLPIYLRARHMTPQHAFLGENLMLWEDTRCMNHTCTLGEKTTLGREYTRAKHQTLGDAPKTSPLSPQSR